jgi:hypothetical protein
MGGGRGRVAILIHERQRSNRLKVYAIAHLAEFWRADGIEVDILSGMKRFTPADLLIVHVDFSVVPEKYLDFARRFPRYINGTLADIRKSAISHLQVRPDTDYGGPVIVKSDLNYAGKPERRLSLLPRAISGHPFASSLDYQIYDHVSQVPPRYFRSPQAVIEQFLPEQEGGAYHVRTLEFLGDHYTSLRLASHQPIVKESTAFEEQDVVPHPAALQACRDMGMEYGKVDYVVHQGTYHLLDVNKTPGASPAGDVVRERRRHRARGIEAFLP